MKNKSSKKSRKTVNIFWLILSIIGIITLIYLVIKSTTLGMFYVRTSGSPSTSVTEFYNALFRSDYDTACTYLKDYDALGMVNDPETFEGKVTFDALKASYSMNLIGSPTIDKLKATQRVSFTYLDINQVEMDTASKIDTILNEKVQTLPREQLFDDNNNYLPELIDEVYNEALTDTLQRASEYYISTEFDIQLEYKNNKWLINTNDTMLKCLLGGI